MATAAAPRTAAPLVSIIIVTYGTGPIVLDALDAVGRFTQLDHEVIVVDSQPPDPAMRTSTILTERADIRLVEANDNLGFAGGNELGVGQARGEFVCFLNPDVIVGPGWLEPLVAALGDPVVAIAAPVLLNPDGTLQEAGQLIFGDTFTAPIGGRDVMPGDQTNVFSRDVDYASAACWVVRRTEHVGRGGFDRRYHPAYFEDADYALRVEAAGQRTRLVADVPVVHHWGQSTSGGDATLGQITHARFRQRWEHDIRTRPARPATPGEAIDARDRLAVRRTVIVAWSDEVDHDDWCDAFADATRRSAATPRERVTMLTDSVPDDAQASAARCAGLEVVVVADPSGRPATEALRTSSADHIDHVRSPRPPQSPKSRSWVPVGIAALVFVVGAVIRWLLLDSPAAGINADEAYARVQSFEIRGGQFPIVLGGTVYTLPVESYLFAPVTYLFHGVAAVPLKLLSTLSWLLTAVVVNAIGTRLVNRRVGLIAAALCWIAPGSLMVLSITAYPAYASGMLVTSFAFLTAVIIVDTPSPGPSWRRLLLFGALAGFAFWLHPMFLTVMVPTAGSVLWTVRRRLDAWLSVIGGGILGCLPLLLWNAVNAWPSLESPAQVPGTYTERLRTFAVDLLPRAFGLRDFGLNWYHDVLGPTLYVALLATFAVGVWSIGRRARQSSHVLLVVVLAAVFPLMALLQNLIYANDGRYAMISFPFVLIALAAGIDRLAGHRPSWRVVGVLTVVAAIWIAGFVRPNTQPFLDARGVDPNAQLTAIVDLLDDAGITRVYGSYWAVLPVDAAGDNRVVGGVFPFWPVRFPERQREVGATPPEDVAVIYMNYDEDTAYLLMPADRYERIAIGDRIVYLPLAHTN